ncbi:uncharacterized protein LOC110612505 [Manihot esculenta]|uniref:At3g05675-like ankyrin-like domain-containing protein n=1 Tax=Manihot esculenta TaxID=3983 RepID=A0A2C9W0A0_MANES|nr:uncharacterized protein LOC110612505 [Manihot esculenta]OAY52217.1 hypothetical protein MANES_04G066200v8 [Manihot esculenta]
MARNLAIIDYPYKSRPSTLLNSLFMSTMNVAAKTLVSVASNLKLEHSEKWRLRDHMRFMVMLMTWVTVWVLRVLMDYFPSVMTFSPNYLLLGRNSTFGSSTLALPAPSSSSTALSTSASSLDLLLQDDFDGPSVQALGRALTHILALLNDIPATSRKYQFAMAMADNIMDGNFRDGHHELMQVNRTALSSAFERTLSLLLRSMQQLHGSDDSSSWTFRLLRALPMGSYISSYVKGLNSCLRTVIQTVRRGTLALQLDKRRQLNSSCVNEGADDVVAEKLAQELLWITNKLRAYDAVDEAMVQWSFASSLASFAFSANPRIQGYIVKISALLIGDLAGSKVEVSTQVKFRLLVLWIPLFCFANNGLSYPFLTSFDKIEVERAIDEAISTLPAMDQEVILINWLQDFTLCASDWPNLKVSYDRWCRCTRQLAQ